MITKSTYLTKLRKKRKPSSAIPKFQQLRNKYTKYITWFVLATVTQRFGQHTTPPK
jgi:hypothetical protein